MVGPVPFLLVKLLEGVEEADSGVLCVGRGGGVGRGGEASVGGGGAVLHVVWWGGWGSG